VYLKGTGRNMINSVIRCVKSWPGKLVNEQKSAHRLRNDIRAKDNHLSKDI
jgi:hypothetical protein